MKKVLRLWGRIGKAFEGRGRRGSKEVIRGFRGRERVEVPNGRRRKEGKLSS